MSDPISQMLGTNGGDDDEAFVIELTRPQLGLVLTLLMDSVVGGDCEYTVRSTGERATSVEVLKELMENILSPLDDDDDDDDGNIVDASEIEEAGANRNNRGTSKR